MNIRGLYNELLYTSILINLSDSILSGFAAFTIIYFVTYFYRISVVFAIAGGIAMFIRSLVIKIRQNKILVLEDKFPNLRERLRTSYDWQEKSNTIIDELHSDIARMMKKIDVNAFLNSKVFALKVIVICAMLSSTLYLSGAGFDILDIRDTIISSTAYQRVSGIAKDIFSETRDQVTDRPLLDNPRLIALGDTDLNISISTYSTELDISNINDANKNDYGGHYPVEIAGVAQETYDERIPSEYREVIKEYFKRINT